VRVMTLYCASGNLPGPPRGEPWRIAEPAELPIHPSLQHRIQAAVSLGG
jgi:hypothetical protein